jgi:hypothetical protein
MPASWRRCGCSPAIPTDCLTHLDDGISRFDLAADETLTIEVRGAHDLAQRCPAIAAGLMEGSRS